MRVHLSEYLLLEFLLYSIVDNDYYGGNYNFYSDVVLASVDVYNSNVQDRKLDVIFNSVLRLFE